MKLAVIGGGSSYSPELIDGLFSRLDVIPVSEVWMMDPDLGRLGITAEFARRMAKRHGEPFRIYHTNNLREAVKDARYVITQLRVGHMAARIADEKLGLRYNIIGQETTGVGGFACALRTIPRVLDIAHAMEEVAPGGVLVNFTNPSGIVTEALIKHSRVTSVGLCNIPIGLIMEIVEHTGCAVDDVEMDYVGLNHLAWVRGFRIAGADRTDEILDGFIARAHEEWEVEAVCANMVEAMRGLRMLCNPYLQYFYANEAMLVHLKNKRRTRGEDVTEVEKALFEKYADPTLDEKPEELSKRGGAHYSTAAFRLIAAIENDTGNRQVVCCRNSGAIPTFDEDVAVEVSATIGKDGATALAQAAPESAIRGLMQAVKAYETLTVEAAVTGSRETAFQAMLMNPIMPGAMGCRRLLDDLLEVNRPHLGGTFF
ncbi:MAG TPA: 6-phospho-beta-glucosidase [Candidatus Hydrogenedentes bacterium]|nr:6-phospho-beta-glucosidase [Candidatus Hydrogenedentota bacterium]HPG66653.1 6-phospho-beta-glucosidase [Candidatus Hydrogenedentota bacterium]